MSIPHENDQAHARRALDEAFERQNRPDKGIAHIRNNTSFCSNPAEYDWKYIERRETHVPYNYNSVLLAYGDNAEPRYPTPGSIRWEIRLVWVVEGRLRKGESNILALRRFYIDADSWLIVLGEGYDSTGEMVNCYMVHGPTIASKAPEGRWYSTVESELKST